MLKERLRIDADRATRFGYWCTDSDLGRFVHALGFMMALVALVAGILLYGILTPLAIIIHAFLLPALAATYLILYFKVQENILYGLSYAYTIRDHAPMYRATLRWYQMNEENREIVRPLVLKIYELSPQKAADGTRLYEKVCEKAFDAIDALYAEQIATEKSLVESESRLQYSGRTSIDNDVQNVLDYVEAMRQVRTEFTSKVKEISN